VATDRAPCGCLHCQTAASFKGDTARMPRTCPTRTHAEEECDAPVTTLVVKDRALDHHPVRALRPAEASAGSEGQKGNGNGDSSGVGGG
jgi:hypothetical protein